jgi:hypothetical protein
LNNETENHNRNQLYIPYQLKVDKEYMIGIGKKQLIQWIIIGLSVLAVGVIIALITGTQIFGWAGVIFGAVGGYMVSCRFESGVSVIDTLSSMINYVREQQYYRYVYRQFQKDGKKIIGGGFAPLCIPLTESEKKNLPPLPKTSTEETDD